MRNILSKIFLFLFCFLLGIFGGGIGAFILIQNPEVISKINLPFSQNKNSSLTLKPVFTSQEKAIINAVKKVSPAVVSIVLTKKVPVFEEYWSSPFDLFPEFRKRGEREEKIGGGSGFIISEDGLILTNRHVVEEEDVDYTVILSNGKKYKAKVLARDPFEDLAIIKINAKNLPTVTLGDSDKLQLGQTVIAIGYALGEFPNTVSVGVISGLFRNISAQGEEGREEYLEGVIQTDAAINQGNSGGPLVNLAGEVIGINVARASGAENIGFAIPINKAKRDIKQIKEKGKLSFPFLGVRYILIDKEIQKRYHLPVDYGAWIVRGERPEEVAVIPGSAADKAGLKENDILLEIDGKKITKENSLAKIILQYDVGDEISIKVLRKGKTFTVKAILGER